MNRKRFSGMFIIGEKRIFQGLAEIIQLGLDAKKIIKEMLNAETVSSVGKLNATVIALEKESDKVAFRMSGEITNGAISSNILDTLLECVDMADNILDSFHYMGREIKRTGNLRFEAKELGNLLAFQSQLNELLDLSEDAMKALKRLLSTSSLEDMQSIRVEIEAIEEKGDNVKDASFDKLYFMAPEMHYLQFMHITELVHKLDDILDSCEDISDLILAVSNSISK